MRISVLATLLLAILVSPLVQGAEVSPREVTDFDGYSCRYGTDCLRYITDTKLRGWKILSYLNKGEGIEDPTIFPKMDSQGASRVSVEYHKGCIIVGGQLRCWDTHAPTGKKFMYGVPLPELADVLDVQVRRDHACALQANGLTCWGTNRPAEMHPLREATAFSTRARAGACAIDADGLKCWNVSEEVAVIPPLKNPTSVDIAENRACAVDGDQVICWGKGEEWNSRCSVEADGKKWCHPGGFNYYALPLLPSPSLHHPREVQMARSFACARDDKRVKCWSTKQFGQLEVPSLRGVKRIKITDSEICAWSQRGLTCWMYEFEGRNNNRYTLTDVPKDLLSSAPYEDYYISPFSEKKGLEGFISQLKKISTAPRALLLGELAGYLKGELPLPTMPMWGWDRERKEAVENAYARYWLMISLKPIVTSGDSKVLEDVASEYIDSVELVQSLEQNEESWAKIDFLVPAKTAANRKLFLKVMQAALVVAENFLTIEERIPVQDALRSIGIAFTSPLNDSLVEAAAAQATSLPALQRMDSNPKSAFLSEMIRESAAWLRASR